LLVAAVAVAGCKKKSASDPGCPPSVAVRVAYPGAAAAEIVAEVIAPIEAAIAGIDAVGSIHALARDGEAVLEVEVAGDPERAARALHAAIERAVLPDAAEPPRVGPVARLERVILATAPLDPGRLAAVEAAVSRLDGARVAAVIGAAEPEVRVSVDAARLAAAGIAPSQIAAALRRSTGDPGAAMIGGVDRSIALRDVATIEERGAERPAVYLGGERVALLVVAVAAKAPDPAALRAAGLDRVSAPIAVASCPRGLARRFDVATARAPDGGAAIARRLAAVPALVLDGADLGDRGIDGVEVIALERGAAIERGLREIPGLEVTPPGAPGLDVEVTAGSPEDLEARTRAVENAARAGGALVIERTPAPDPAPEMRVEIDAERANRLGVVAADVAAAVRGAQRGEVAAIRRDGGRAVPIRVFVGEPASTPEQLMRLEIEAGGVVVPLAAVARITRSADSSAIYRRDRLRRVRLRISVDGDAARDAMRAAVTAAGGEVIAAR
jgi:multidrug efflux pump subunit AcrB